MTDNSSDCIQNTDTYLWGDMPMTLHDTLDHEMFSYSDPKFLKAVSVGTISFFDYSTLVSLVDTAMLRLEAVKTALNASPHNLASLPETEV